MLRSTRLWVQIAHRVTQNLHFASDPFQLRPPLPYPFRGAQRHGKHNGEEVVPLTSRPIIPTTSASLRLTFSWLSGSTESQSNLQTGHSGGSHTSSPRSGEVRAIVVLAQSCSLMIAGLSHIVTRSFEMEYRGERGYSHCFSDAAGAGGLQELILPF